MVRHGATIRASERTAMGSFRTGALRTNATPRETLNLTFCKTCAAFCFLLSAFCFLGHGCGAHPTTQAQARAPACAVLATALIHRAPDWRLR